MEIIISETKGDPEKKAAGIGKESIRQQKGEGWFPTFSYVSEKAISMSVMMPHKNARLFLTNIRPQCYYNLRVRKCCIF